jgi:hypothetical protein
MAAASAKARTKTRPGLNFGISAVPLLEVLIHPALLPGARTQDWFVKM